MNGTATAAREFRTRRAISGGSPRRSRMSRPMRWSSARLAPSADMQSYDLKAILGGICDEDMSLRRGDPSRIFDRLGDSGVGARRFSGVPPKERHPAGDQLLHVLEGELDVCVLAPQGRMSFPLQAGSVF